MSILKVNTIQHANGTEAMTIDSSGNLSFPQNITSAIKSTGGIYLGGTTAANLLDDYEEGTWTPTLTAGATGLTNEQGAYRKIGDMVYLQMYVSLSGITGDVTLDGLPFAPNDVYSQSQVENTGILFAEAGHSMWSVYSGNSIHIHCDQNDIFSNGDSGQPTTGNWRGSMWYRTTE